MRRVLVLVAVVAMMLAAALPASATPGDGNGKKIVIDEVNGPFPLGCGDVTVTFHEGIQIRHKATGKNDVVSTFNVEFEFENGSGQTWVFKVRGADRVFEENGRMYLAIAGRSGLGNIGRLLVDVTDGFDVLSESGHDAADPFGEACERLA